MGRMRAEVRTVNHRYFSANLRLAALFERFEPQIREWLRAIFHAVTSTFHCDSKAHGRNGNPLVLDVERAQAYLALLRT